MSNTLIGGLFLVAFFAPPLAVVACTLLLFVKAPSAQLSSAPTHSALAAQ